MKQASRFADGPGKKDHGRLPAKKHNLKQTSPQNVAKQPGYLAIDLYFVAKAL